MRTQSSAGAYKGAGLSFYAEEGQETHANPEVGWRVDVGWPYYFLQRRGGKHTLTQRSAGVYNRTGRREREAGGKRRDRTKI